MLASRDFTLSATGHDLYDRLRAAAQLSIFVDKGVLQQRDLAKGTLGVAAGNPVVGYDGDLGMVIDFDGTGDRLSYSAHPWVANSDATMAVIIKIDTLAVNDSMLTTRAASNVGLVMSLDGGSGTTWRLTKGGVVSIDSSITLSTGVPYFLAVSYRHSTGDTRFVTRRLDTGAITLANATNSTAYSAGDGTFTVGGDQNFTTDLDCKIAAAYISDRCFVTDELQMWSLDPFALWIDSYSQPPVLKTTTSGFFSRYYYDMRAKAA